MAVLHSRTIAAAVAGLLLCGAAAGQWSPLAAPPPFSPERADDPPGASKTIPFGGDGNYASFGGEIRERYEYVRNGAWGREPADDNGYLLQRYMLHADVHAGGWFRIFGQLKSGIESGRNGGPRPADEDRLDVQQAFIDLRLPQVQVRAGRQELAFGSSRLVSYREGPNVRQTFDGARLTWQPAKWRVDVFAVKPVETAQGVFDDSPDHTRSFWGAYATRKHLDVYYLGLDRKRARFDAGTGREQRHSVGARVWGTTERWDYNGEGVWQWGRFGSGGIRAWTAASDTGYRFDGARLKPRLGLKADIASGDGNPADRTLGTFNALFPRGSYFSEADLLGPYNLMDLHPSVELHPAAAWKLTPEADFFWRESTHDGIYGIAGNLIQSGQAAAARYVGMHAGISAEWRADRHTTLTATYLHFFPGEFLRQAPPGHNVNFVALWVTYKF